LVHEWAHYALFLYDEYQDTDLNGSAETYCTCIDLPAVSSVVSPTVCGGVTANLAASAMSLHYTASELWLNGTPSVCMGTDQWLVHGTQDWQTLKHWSHIQGLTPEWLHVPGTLSAGPDLGLAGKLFGIWPGNRLYLPLVAGGNLPAAVFAEPTISLTISGLFTAGDLSSFYPQVYVTTSAPARISYQGTTDSARLPPNRLGKITLLGVPQAGGRARIYLDRYATIASPGARFIYPPPGGADPPLSKGQTLQVVTDTWRASLDVAYGMAGRLLSTMTITLTSMDALASTPVVQLCVPDSGCPTDPSWRKSMLPSGPTAWTTTFTAAPGGELPHNGVLDVQAGVQAAGQRDLMRWYLAMGGVGPAHIDGNAPLRDGLAMVDAVQPVPGASSQVVIMPATDYNALSRPLPGNIRGFVAPPLDLDVLLPNEAPLHPGEPAHVTQASPSGNTVAPPRANFNAFPTAGVAPLTVHFSNTSSGSYFESIWAFGDGAVSTLQNPTHTYTTPGTYTVTLTVTGQGGSDAVVRKNFVRVRQPGTLVVTLFYSQAVIDRLGVREDQLVVLHFDPRENVWQIVQTSSRNRSATLNWLTTAPVDSDGIYAIGWVAGAEAGAAAPPD
jgi:hypothetical protein